MANYHQDPKVKSIALSALLSSAQHSKSLLGPFHSALAVRLQEFHGGGARVLQK